MISVYLGGIYSEIWKNNGPSVHIWLKGRAEVILLILGPELEVDRRLFTRLRSSQKYSFLYNVSVVRAS